MTNFFSRLYIYYIRNRGFRAPRLHGINKLYSTDSFAKAYNFDAIFPKTVVATIVGLIIGICKRAPTAKIGNSRFETPYDRSTQMRILRWQSLHKVVRYS